MGIKWGLQIFHGTENEEFIKELLKDFNNVVYENLNIQNFKDRQTHTKILKTTDFWKKSKGEKILIFQNDSMLLKSGIEEFLKWDYIGAPWKTPKEGCLVGNGGLSLRTKAVLNRTFFSFVSYFMNLFILKYQLNLNIILNL